MRSGDNHDVLRGGGCCGGGGRRVLCPFDVSVHLLPPCCDFFWLGVINEKNESLQDETTANKSTDDDPFAIPDFLNPKPKRPKLNNKCHHCQKKKVLNSRGS